MQLIISSRLSMGKSFRSGVIRDTGDWDALSVLLRR